MLLIYMRFYMHITLQMAPPSGSYSLTARHAHTHSEKVESITRATIWLHPRHNMNDLISLWAKQQEVKKPSFGVAVEPEQRLYSLRLYLVASTKFTLRRWQQQLTCVFTAIYVLEGGWGRCCCHSYLQDVSYTFACDKRLYVHKKNRET